MAKKFMITHGFYLKSADKVLMPKSHFTCENEEQERELTEIFVPHGACVEIVSRPKDEEPKKASKSSKKADDNTPPPLANPDEDITVVPGVGASLQKKLEEAGITTVTALKVAVSDARKADQMKELLGLSYDKVLKHFSPDTPAN